MSPTQQCNFGLNCVTLKCGGAGENILLFQRARQTPSEELEDSLLGFPRR